MSHPYNGGIPPQGLRGGGGTSSVVYRTLNGVLNNMAFDSGMNSQQIEYFRRRLLTWRDELVSESEGTSYGFGQDAPTDFREQAANATHSGISSQSPQDREQTLIHKIDEALHQIEAGTYGMGKA